MSRVTLALKVDYGRAPPPGEMLAMFRAALNGLAQEPRRMVLVEERTPGHFVVRANGKTQEFAGDDLDWLWRLLFRLKDVAEFVDTALAVKTYDRGAQLEQAMVDGLLQHVGPRGLYLPPAKPPNRALPVANTVAALSKKSIDAERIVPLCEDGAVVGRFEYADGAVLELPMKRTCAKQ